jgi:hypothetical protein
MQNVVSGPSSVDVSRVLNCSVGVSEQSPDGGDTRLPGMGNKSVECIRRGHYDVVIQNEHEFIDRVEYAEIDAPGKIEVLLIANDTHLTRRSGRYQLDVRIFGVRCAHRKQNFITTAQ